VKYQSRTTAKLAFKKFAFEDAEVWFGKRLLRRDRSEVVVYLAIIGYALVFSYFTILKYEAFNAYAWDLGIFNQSFWTTAHAGRFFFSTVEQYVSLPGSAYTGSFFVTHFSPVLFFVFPFYCAVSLPQTLLVFQSFVLALGAIPLYFFSKSALNNRVTSVAVTLAYLLYPPLQGVNWFDFHVQAFLPFFIFSAFYFLFKEKWPHYFLFIVLSFTVSENVPITVVFVGLYCFWRFRENIFQAVKSRMFTKPCVIVPFLTIASALAWLFFAGLVKGAYFPVNPVFDQLYKAASNWHVLGLSGDPIGLPYFLIKNLVPVSGTTGTFAALVYDYPLKLLYICLLFGPLLFLSIRSSIAAITLAWLVPALFSNYPTYYLIGNHYPAYPLPFIFLAAVEALKPKPQLQTPTLPTEKLYSLAQPISRRLGGLSRKIQAGNIFKLPSLKTCTKLLLVCSVLFALFVSPLSPTMTAMKNVLPYFSDYYPPTITAHDQMTQKIAALVPKNASILTVSNIFAHFSDRVNAYAYPLEWVVQRYESDLEGWINGLITASDYIIIDNQTAPFESDRILNNAEFSLQFGLNSCYSRGYDATDNTVICLFKRGYNAEEPVYVFSVS
jgi:uncharacterized membrane protein